MGITVKGTLHAPTPEIAARVRDGLPEHIRLSRAESGNIRFNITQADSPDTWIVDEEFIDAAAFDAHKARMATADWAEQSVGLARDLVIKDTA